MKRDEVMRILREHAGELRAMGVASLAIFGSTARDEACENSDVDLLVAFSRRVSLFEFFRLQHRLEAMLDVQKVDLVQRGAVHPALRDLVQGEAIEALHVP